MRLVLAAALASAINIGNAADFDRVAPLEFSAVVPAVTVGEVVPGVFGCPYANAPACQPQAAFNFGRLTMPDDVPIRTADPYRTGGHCSLDDLNGRSPIFDVMRVHRGEPLKVSGWAFNDVRMPDETLFILSTSAAQFRAPVTRSRSRPDVAQYFKIPTLVDSGFDGAFGLSRLPDGIYDISILMRNGTVVTICHITPKLQIKSE